MSDNKDFTDYFLVFLNTGREAEFFPAFNKLVEEAKSVEIEKVVETYDYEYIDFYEAIKEKYINKPISFSAIVRGEAAKPYIYPVRVRITCGVTRGNMCTGCGLFLTGGNIEVSF